MGDGLAFSLRKMLRRGPGPPRRESVTIDRAKMKEAKEMVEGAPKTIKKDVKKEEADELVEKLKAAGGEAELE